MDEIRNPFAPGAGNPPPELAGRREILRKAEVVLDRTLAGRHAKSFMLVGLRGVGKTVLLNRIGQLAEVRKLHWYLIESPEDKPLPDLLVPALRRPDLALLDTWQSLRATARPSRCAAPVEMTATAVAPVSSCACAFMICW